MRHLSPEEPYRHRCDICLIWLENGDWYRNLKQSFGPTGMTDRLKGTRALHGSSERGCECLRVRLAGGAPAGSLVKTTPAPAPRGTGQLPEQAVVRDVHPGLSEGSGAAAVRPRVYRVTFNSITVFHY